MLGKKTELSLKAQQPTGQQPLGLSELNMGSAEARTICFKKWMWLISLEIISCTKTNQEQVTEYDAWQRADYCKPENYVGRSALESRCCWRH